jgi:hypothetical protein
LSFTTSQATRWIVAPALSLATAAYAACPAPAATDLLERFVPADCENCWRTGSAPAGAPFVLDWIVPAAQGDEAPLSAAALAEATARAGPLTAGSTLQRRQALPPLPGLSLGVRGGPAWLGYIGLQFAVQRSGAALPDGAAGYLALVETVRAGDDDTPVERRLVRAVAGPLALDAAGSEHLLAVRVPPFAKPERLTAVGWVEIPSGRVVALAPASAPDCAVAP